MSPTHYSISFNNIKLVFHSATYHSVALYARQVFPHVLCSCEVHLTDGKTQLTDGVVLREAVVVVHGEHKRLAHHVAVRNLKDWNISY
jgi:hypothetical protein